MGKKIPNDAFRIVKVGREALLEFICENMIAEQDRLLNLDRKAAVVSCFDINWEAGELIFVARNEREKKDDLQLPDEIDLQLLMAKMADTTKSLFSSRRQYVDLSLDEIVAIQNYEPEEGEAETPPDAAPDGTSGGRGEKA